MDLPKVKKEEKQAKLVIKIRTILAETNLALINKKTDVININKTIKFTNPF